MAPADVEIEPDEYSRSSTNEGVLPWLVRWAHGAGTRDLYPALAALVNPVQNIFFLAAHYFTLFVPIAQQPERAVVPGHLSLV